MAKTYQTPGVYREEVFLKPEGALPTGVPGFVGFADSAANAGTPVNLPVALHRKEEFAGLFGQRADSFLAEAVTGFFDNGGVRCYVVRAEPDATKKDRETALKEGLDALTPINDLDLIAIPDAMTLTAADATPDADAVIRVQQAMFKHCQESASRFAILDTLPWAKGAASAETPAQRRSNLIQWRDRLTASQIEPVNGALYFPWLGVQSGGQGVKFVPPSGHVAGIYARTDAKAGVFKAPANEELLGVLSLGFSLDDQVDVDNALQDELNPVGINCLRAFRGRGIRVWGARTLSRDPVWRYVSVRRLFLTVSRWVDQNMAWAAFEPNEPRLWVRIQRELNTYFGKLLRDGALKGASPSEAFYVKCDLETNPSELREVGQVVTEIGLAPLVPAEFIVVRIIHRAGAAEVG